MLDKDSLIYYIKNKKEQKMKFSIEVEIPDKDFEKTEKNHNKRFKNTDYTFAESFKAFFSISLQNYFCAKPEITLKIGKK